MKPIAITFMLLLATTLISQAQILENTSITNGTFVASSFINDNEGWLADSNGKLWHTNNGGQKWDSISIAKKFLKLDFTDALDGFALSSEVAYKTTDGGITWSALMLPGNIGKAICFVNSSTGFISSYGGIYKTDDGGGTWSTLETEGVSFLDYYFINTSVGVAVAHEDESNQCVWRTTDGGATWSNVFAEENYYMNSVWFLDENTGWAVGYYDRAGLKEPAILKTTDGGLTWQKNYRYTQISSDGELLTDIRFRNELEGYALSQHNYDLYTTDGGETWNLVNDTDALSATPVFGVYKTLDGYNDLYLIGQSGTVSKWK